MFSNNKLPTSTSCINVELKKTNNSNRSSPASHQETFTTTSATLKLRQRDVNKYQTSSLTKALTHHQNQYQQPAPSIDQTETISTQKIPITMMMTTEKTVKTVKTATKTTKTTTKPVEQPKNINLLKNLNPNLTQLQLKVVNSKNNNNLRLSCNNSKNSGIIDDITTSSKHNNNNNNRSNHRNGAASIGGSSSSGSGSLQNKLAISLGSFSDLIRKTTPTPSSASEEKMGDDHSNTNDEDVAATTTDPPPPSSTKTATISKNKNSTSNFSGKLCSPPPLSGKDIEHHHATSHMRRFELEI